jgi:AraC-like DNA-binding protein
MTTPPAPVPSAATVLDAVTVLHPRRAVLAEYPAGAVLGTRTIDDWELVWMLKGRAHFRTDGGDTVLQRADMVVIPPHVPHSFVWDVAGPSRHGYLHFRALDPAGRDVRAPAAVSRVGTGDPNPLSELARFLIWLSDSALPGRRARTADVLRLMLSLIIDGPLPGPARRLAPAVAAALDHLAVRWAATPLRPVTVAELAAAGGVSGAHLHRLFSREFGVSPAAAMELLRLSRATALLGHTNLTVDTVAGLCGFADAAHLSHRLRKVNGSTATALRRGDATLFLPPGVQRIAAMLWR